MVSRPALKICFADVQSADKVKRVLIHAADIRNILEHDPESIDKFMQYWVHDNSPNHPDSKDSQALFEY